MNSEFFIPASPGQFPNADGYFGALGEGIIPAIEGAQALADVLEVGTELGPDGLILVNLSGWADKDMDTAARYFATDADGAVAEGVAK